MSAQRMTGMTPQRLLRLIDAHGADPLRWPETERAAALALVAQSAAARDLVAWATKLDGALGALAVDVPDAAMARLIAATTFPPPRRAAAGRGYWLDVVTAFWPRAAVLASMAMLGVVVGLSVEPAFSNSDRVYFVSGEVSMDIVEDVAP